MNSLGMLSAYSAYTQSINSVYSPSQVSFVKNKQEISPAEDLLTDASSGDDINDEAIISDEAKALLASEESETKQGNTDNNTDNDTSNKPSAKMQEELTLEEKQVIAKLKARDAEVKAHEQAHIAAAAGISASAPHYDYEIGPDGKKYAVGGEVNISFIESSDPAENIAKAKAMKAAALAPAQPSAQDRAVANDAARIIAENKQELKEQQKELIQQSNSANNQIAGIEGFNNSTTDLTN
ncbi:MAG: putative metalloprotease CJM1_0395 family protein [Candidatus Gastranaerophilales bacterium]|nr:putative metalloprotease CJM1_0395 family protein [Candidatus Gastranaerophilales bacterium]